MKSLIPTSSLMFLCLAAIWGLMTGGAYAAPASKRGENAHAFRSGTVRAEKVRESAEVIDGYLVVEVVRCAYSFNDSSSGSSTTRAFKIPVSAEFLGRFKNRPSQHSMGTGFFIGTNTLPGGVMKGTRFLWGIRRTTDGRWQITLGGVGAESLDGRQVQAMNPRRSTGLVLRRWDDIDMYQRISYSGDSAGVKATFSVKYRAAGESGLDEIPLITIPAGEARVTIMDPVDEDGDTAEGISCGFQED